MEIKRDIYLNELILRLHNGMIKVITEIHKCGKSYLITYKTMDSACTPSVVMKKTGNGLSDCFFRDSNVGFVIAFIGKHDRKAFAEAIQ